jgi:hypothetical protein
MDALDCPSMELSDHSLCSTSARWLCVELGDHGCSRSVCGGGGSLHRSPTPDLYVSECPGIGHCLALGAAGRNDFHCLPTGSAFIASHSQSDHSRFPPFSGTLSSVDGHNHSCNSIPGVWVAIKIEQSSALYREPENQIPEGGQTIALERIGRAANVASHRLKHHLNRYPIPEWAPGCRRALRWCPAQRRVHQQVYLHLYAKELMLRNHV